MSGVFGIAITSLRAAQVGLSTAGHNIANASTEGFHRQEIVQSSNIPLSTGAGFIGQGVNVDTVKRVYSLFLDRQVQTAQTQSAYLEAYSAQIVQLDNMLADPDAGLSPALQDFFKGVNDVAANPASVPSRQSMISSADVLVSRLHTLDGRLQEVRDGVNAQVVSSASVITSYAKQIAEINGRIVLAEAGGNGQPPNDLLDQRDQLVADLNKEINVSVVKQSDGAYNIFMGQGQALVVGQQSFSLTARPSADDPSRMDVAYVANGSTQFLPQDSLDGGNLGGLLRFRSETLDAAQNAMGRVAIGIAQSVNDQQRLGLDLNGDLGGAFFNVRGPSGIGGAFTVPSAKVVANTNNSVMTVAGLPAVTLTDVSKVSTSDYALAYSAAGYTLTRLSDKTVMFANAALPQTIDGLTIVAPSTAPASGDSWLIQPTRDGARDISVAIRDTAKIAAAAPVIGKADYANTGTGRISAGVVDAVTQPPVDANLQKLVTITFTSATTFDVSSPASVPPIALTGVPYTEGADISYNGWIVQITGTPSAGDVFSVDRNANGVSDNRNILLLAGLQTEKILAGGSASFQSAYSQIVSSIGIKARDINVMGKAQASLVTQSQQAQQSMSGVNLDEEAANLLRYQQAYQASGKMMQIATTLFETLLSLGS